MKNTYISKNCILFQIHYFLDILKHQNIYLQIKKGWINLILAPEAFKHKKLHHSLYIIKFSGEEIIRSICKSLQVWYTYISSGIAEGLIPLTWQANLLFCLEYDQVMDIAEWSMRLHSEPSKRWIRFRNLIQNTALECQSGVFFVTNQYGWQAQERCKWIKHSECFSLSALTSGFGFLNQKKPTPHPWKPLNYFL